MTQKPQTSNQDKPSAAAEQAGTDEDSTPAGDTAAKPGTIFIELQRNLHGWGSRDQILEVEHTAEVDGLIENEHAVRLAKKDVIAVDGGGWALAPSPAS